MRKLWRRLWNWTPLYWLRCHLWTRYHIIDIRTPDYRWGWIDKDQAMLLACFKLLVDYVELERCFEVIDYQWNEEYQRLGNEIKELYDWWKVKRFQDEKEVDKMWRTSSLDDWHFAREMLNLKENLMLGRLIAIRETLWT